MKRSTWVAIAVAASFVVVALAWFRHSLSDSERRGKLWAECQNRYTPACDDLEKP